MRHNLYHNKPGGSKLKYAIAGHDGYYDTHEAAAIAVTNAIAWACGHITDFEFDFANDTAIIKARVRNEDVAYLIAPVEIAKIPVALQSALA